MENIFKKFSAMKMCIIYVAALEFFPLCIQYYFIVCVLSFCNGIGNKH